MSDLPLVSIVVVSYNQGKYIRENLDSIKAQTYPNIELLVADDASPDNSVEVFNEWLIENNYPAQTNYHTKNTGLATTLNECVEMVTGKYIKFIAADDFLHPDYIQKCVLLLEELDANFGMVFTNMMMINENSHIVGEHYDYDAMGLVEKEFFRKELRKGNRIGAPSVLMKKNVIQETGPYSEDMVVEDYQKWLQINEKYFIAYIPDHLVYYRLHGQNISFQKRERIALETLALQIKYDFTGDNKDYINEMMQLFYSKNMLAHYAPLTKLFDEYRLKRPLLAFCIKNRFPFIIFRALKKFSTIFPMSSMICILNSYFLYKELLNNACSY